MNFFSRYKKIIWLIVFIFCSILIGYLLYLMFFSTPEETTIPDQEPAATSSQGSLPQSDQRGGNQPIDEEGQWSLPDSSLMPKQTEPIDNIAQGGLTQTTQLNQVPSLSMTLDKNGNGVQYYDKSDGKFYFINQLGEISLLSNTVFPQVENVVWSPNKNKAIIEFPDGANIIYDFEKKEQITLPQHWEDFSYSPNGQQIVMKSIGQSEENRWLAITSEDGSRTKAIEELGANQDKVITYWSPNNQSVALFIEGVSFDQQELYFVGKNQENFKSTKIEGRGFQPKWSPAGDKLLYSVYSSKNDMKPSLWIVDALGNQIGNNRVALNIETWAEKCAFTDASTVYCAVPESLEEGAGMIPALADNTKDQLYKINLQSRTKSLIAITEQSYNISNLVVSVDGSILYFTDKTNQNIHQIRLK